MTREEAIEILQGAIKKPNTKDGYLGQAIDMAIKALEQEPCEDVISRQALLNDFGLSEKTRKWGGDHSGYNTMMLYEIQDMIESAPSVKQEPKWIPVSERLPEKGEYGKVLVTYIPSGGILWTTVIVAHYSDLMGIASPSFYIGEAGEESFQNITKQVKAWMPLPKPYKAESE